MYVFIPLKHPIVLARSVSCFQHEVNAKEASGFWRGSLDDYKTLYLRDLVLLCTMLLPMVGGGKLEQGGVAQSLGFVDTTSEPLCTFSYGRRVVAFIMVCKVRSKVLSGNLSIDVRFKINFYRVPRYY